MTKADLIDAVSEATGQRKKDVASAVEAAFAAMLGALRRREKVQIVGFGTFEPRRRKARTGRDPRTQEVIRIGASWSLNFRPGKQLKGILTGRESKRHGRAH